MSDYKKQYVESEIANRIALVDLGVPYDRTLDELTPEEWCWYEPIYAKASNAEERLSDEDWVSATEEIERRSGAGEESR